MPLFTEIFPVDYQPEIIPYRLVVDEDVNPTDIPRMGRTLTRRLKKAYPGNWLWTGTHILAEEERSVVELMMTLDFARDQNPDLFMYLDTIEPDPDWQFTPEALSDYVIRVGLDALAPTLKATLSKFNMTIPARDGNVHVEREYRLTPQNVSGTAAVSLSVATRLAHEQDLQTFALAQDDPKSILNGLRVRDRDSGFTGEIKRLTGTVGERRDKMRTAADRAALTHLIEAAPDADFAVQVIAGARGVEYPASALVPLLRPSEFALFGVNRDQATTALRPDPATRSHYVKLLSDIAKEAGLLARAFNSRENSEHFLQPEFEPYLRFDGNRSRPYDLTKLANDFNQCGAYHLRDAFHEAPIRVCVVNALSMKLEDFVEAMQRQLSRSFAFTIDMVRERQVRVVSLANLEAAVRVVEAENPDLVLAFLPESAKHAEGEDDLKAYVKSLTLGRAIPAHVIFEATLDEPEAMTGLIMAILAKTGNTPFALADPLEFTDFVVGLDLVRKEDKSGVETQITAIARIYRTSGEFVRYAVRDVTLEGDTLPFVLMRDLFPQRDFAKKRVVIHHDGRLPDDTRQALALWGQAIGANFFTVEIVRRGAPRLYALEGGQIQAPQPGSAFKLNEREAFLVLTHDPVYPTPQPLHLIASGLGVEQAIQSVQSWTLLYYGTTAAPQFPVTTFNAGELAYWLRKGGTFTAETGEVPFWL